MTAEALAAEAVASRLERQEEDIRWLWAEVHRLRDEQLNAPDRCQAEGPCLTREVAQLRAENRELRHRLYHLRLCLAEELSHRARQESPAREEARRAAAGAQVPRGRHLRGRGGWPPARCLPLPSPAPRPCLSWGTRDRLDTLGRCVSSQRPADLKLECLSSSSKLPDTLFLQ